MLVALAENLVGDPVAAERAVRDAEAIVSGPGDRWYQSMGNVDLAHTIIARADVHRTLAEALHAAGQTAEAVAEADRALALDERKANVVVAATTRRLLASLGAQARV